MLVKLMAAAGASLLLLATGAMAQDGPRAYHMVPEGTDVLSLTGMFQTATRIYPDGSPIETSALDIAVFTPTYRTSFEVNGNAADFLIGLPLGQISGEFDFGGGPMPDESPFAQGDLLLMGVLGLVGSPYLSPMDYAQHKPGWRVGVATKVYVPTGDYDSSRLLNLGQNRWSVQASLPISFVLAESMLDPELTTFEIVPSVHVFGDNNDSVGNTVVTSTAPMFGLEAHVTRNFGPMVWASLDGFFQHGGATSEDGGPYGDATTSLSLGATLGLNLSANFALRMSYDEQVYSSVPAETTNRSVRVTGAYIY